MKYDGNFHGAREIIFLYASFIAGISRKLLARSKFSDRHHLNSDSLDVTALMGGQVGTKYQAQISKLGISSGLPSIYYAGHILILGWATFPLLPTELR